MPPERSFPMESFDGHAGESQVTAVFVEQEGKTTLTATALYTSRDVRDAVWRETRAFHARSVVRGVRIAAPLISIFEAG
ncbi:MAG: hypothetical protein M3Z85_14645 [Acidobacteriota bacterium]|nr:hypothetical protein [Acidobacteriota bacterium]